MGASVRAETGAFHNPVGNFQLEEHRGSVGLPPGPPLAHIGRRRALPGIPGPAPAPGNSAAPAGSAYAPAGCCRSPATNPASSGRSPGLDGVARQHAQARDFGADGRRGRIHVRRGGESPQRQPQRALRELGAAPQRAQHVTRLARRGAAGRTRWTPRSPASPVTRLSPSTPAKETLISPGTPLLAVTIEAGRPEWSRARATAAPRGRARARHRPRPAARASAAAAPKPDDLVRGQRARAQPALVTAAELDRRDPRPRRSRARTARRCPWGRRTCAPSARGNRRRARRRPRAACPRPATRRCARARRAPRHSSAIAATS